MATRPYVIPTLKTPTKPVTLFILPSGQVYNTYYGDPFGNNENSAMEWLTFHTDGGGGILSRCANQPKFEAYGIMPPLEVVGDDKVNIIQAIRLVADYARQYPNQKVICLSLHTDSGSDQHFGTFWLQGESKKYMLCLEAELAKVWGFARKFSMDMTGQGYYALGQGNAIPSNLLLGLAELGSHATKANVLEIEGLVDALAQTIPVATNAYLGSAPIPPTTDWQARALAAEAKIAAAKAALG